MRDFTRNLELSKAVMPHTLNTLSALGYLRRKRDESGFPTISITPTPNEARFLERLEKFIGQDRPARSGFGLYGADAA